MTDALSHFSAPVRDWFRAAFSAPTAAQEGAWESIRNGNNTLIIAPTGSGKTLAAFLDVYKRQPGYYIDPVRSAVTKKQLNTTSVQTMVNMHAWTVSTSS